LEAAVELRHLRYFVAVAEELSFRKAARRLSVSEAAISQQVAALEDELGQKLFNRDSRRVELTEIGHVFLHGARRTLTSAKEAVAQAQEAATGERGRLTIGSIGPLVHAFLPDALAKFREHFPLVEVTVLNMDDRTQVEALANGTIMLGIGWAGPSLAESESLTAKFLLRCSFALACAAHRWPVTRGKPNLSDFREDNFLARSTERGSDFVNLLRAVCQRNAGFEPNFLTVGNSLESLLSMVAAGRGVLLAPQILFRHPTAGVSVHILDGAKEKFKMFLMRRKMPEPVATVDHFIKILTQSLPPALQRRDPG
jgi:LysR family transcriptional regulator, benzoate and cis,cis-muconate-responsive activator of ben and cat genes